MLIHSGGTIHQLKLIRFGATQPTDGSWYASNDTPDVPNFY